MSNFMFWLQHRHFIFRLRLYYRNIFNLKQSLHEGFYCQICGKCY